MAPPYFMGFHCKLSPDRRVMRTRPKQDEAVDLLDLLIEQVVDYAIFALDSAGNIASWNAGAERIKGYAPARDHRQAVRGVLHRGRSAGRQAGPHPHADADQGAISG